MRDDEKVVIGWIDGGTIHSGFAAYLCQILLNRNERILGQVAASGPYLSLNRNEMVELFLQTDADWLFSIDTDLCVPLESFDSLIQSADKIKRPIVAGKYYLPFDNGANITPSAQTMENNDPDPEKMGHWVTPEELTSAPILDGLHSVGIGYVLIHRDVFLSIRAVNPDNKFPWFRDEWKESWGAWVSDDLGFFNQVRGLGINIALDTQATSTHLKQFGITDDVFLKRMTSQTAQEHNHHMHPNKKLSWWNGKKK